jgi:aubergine-like protein
MDAFQGAIQFSNHHLELWPGYTTSIRQHDLGILMCCDPIFKCVRTDTVLDQMRYMQREGATQDDMKKALVGSIIITRYNNRTYRIDDIAFTLHPTDSFTVRSFDLSFQFEPMTDFLYFSSVKTEPG